jgi:TolB-like protein
MTRTRFLSFVAGMLALGTASARPAAAQQAADQRPTLAVMYFNNSSMVDRSSYDALSKGVADMLISDLAAMPGIRVVERDQLQKLLEEQDLTTMNRVDPATAAKVGKLLGAQHMIFGGFFVDPKGTLRLDARAVNVETSAIEHVESVQGKSDDILGVIAQLAGKLTKGLKLATTAPAERPAGDAPSGGRFKALVLYSRALVEDDQQHATEALALYKQFLDGTPVTFATDQRSRAEARVKELSRSGL